MRTPAMQAGLATRQLSFRDIFMAVEVVRFFFAVGMVVIINAKR